MVHLWQLVLGLVRTIALCMTLQPTTQANGVATSYGNSDQVLEALTTGVVIAERSHWGRIRVAGEDRLAFLHNQVRVPRYLLNPCSVTLLKSKC